MAQTQKKKSFANILSGGDKTVALDIGSRYVKLAILHRRNSGVEARYLDEMPIPFASSRGDVTPEAVKDTVRQILQRNKLKDIGVLSVMSRDFVTVSHLELPSADRGQIKQMLVFEAESHLPFAMERAITAFDFKPIEAKEAAPEEGGENGGEAAEAAPTPTSSKVVFAAVRQALIPKFLELHSQKGLKQTAIQVSSFAIFNLYDYLKRSGKLPETSGDTLIIEMGARRTEFLLVNAEGELAFTRSVEKGGDDLTSYIAAKEGISFEEAEQRKIEKWDETCLADPAELLTAMQGICEELDRTIRFLRSRGLSEGVKNVCFSGGGAARAEICSVLSAPCGVGEPLYLNGLDAIQTKRKGAFGPSYSAVLGAALAQIGEAAIYIDLLPVDVVKLQMLAMRRKMLIKLAVGVAAVAVLALLVLGGAVLISNSKVEAKNKELRSKLTETKKVDLLEKRNAQLQKAVNDIEGVISRKTSWNSVLSGISSCMTSNLWITSIGVDKNNTMTLEGYSRNADYLIFEENMQRQLRFENVIVPSEKTMMQYGLQVHYFKLTCDILPDYKYNEKLRSLLGESAVTSGKAEEAAEKRSEPPAAGLKAESEKAEGGAQESPAEPPKPDTSRETPKTDVSADIMSAPQQGTPFRLSNPASAPVAPRSRVAEPPAPSGAQGETKPANVVKPARSGRLMDRKKEAEQQTAAEAAKAEAKAQEEAAQAVTEAAETAAAASEEAVEAVAEETAVVSNEAAVSEDAASSDESVNEAAAGSLESRDNGAEQGGESAGDPPGQDNEIEAGDAFEGTPSGDAENDEEVNE